MESKLRSDLLKTPSVHLVSIIESLIAEFGVEASAIATEKLRTFQQCWIVKLTPDTFSSISSQWLTLSEFCRLDSAFCHSELRPQFKQCVQQNCILFTQPTASELKIQPFIHWIMSRQIRLDRLNLNYRKIDVQLLIMYLKVSGDSLRSIDFAGANYLTEDCVGTMIQCCPNLEVLSCWYCSNVAVDFVGSLFSHCTALRELDLSFVSANVLGGLWSDFEGISVKTSALTKLYLNYQHNFRDEHLCPIVSTCTRLLELSLVNCTNLTRVSFDAIGSYLVQLTSLHACNTSIHDTELIQIVQNCTQLECLSLNDCVGVTEPSLTAILHHRHNLTQLSLNHNPHVTDTFLDHVHTNLPQLTKFYINGCHAVTPSGVLCVVKNCALLNIFSVKEYTPGFDEAVRQGIIAGKHWLGTWKDRKLSLYLSTV